MMIVKGREGMDFEKSVEGFKVMLCMTKIG